ncbi:MAG TPA: pyridoxal-phosphate dependent enzyme, partial [Sphingomonadaceae bacterium]|nr:pyridoxal-phosphate dependent enzyme [Sphingomonadaceae bacterium]
MATSLAHSEPLPVSLDDVRAAHARIAGAIIRTPTLLSRTLSELTGANVWLKFENLQFTAAYKERGALNKLLQLSDEARARGVIAASAGNHAQGLAYHGARLGIPVTIVMPRPTPTVKVQQTEGHGATVILTGERFDDAYAAALTVAEERGLTFVHPFDDPMIIAGQGTVALEMLEDAPRIDTLAVPIGGGGLISGCATVAKAAGRPIEVIGVQAELYPSMFNRINAAALPCEGDTLAEGIAVKVPGALTSRIIAERVDDIVLVSER